MINLIKEKDNQDDFEVFNYSSNEFLICGEYPAPFMFNLTTSIDADASDTYNDMYVTQGHIDEVFEKIKDANEDDIFVIGGSSIYNQFMPFCDTFYITHILL